MDKHFHLLQLAQAGVGFSQEDEQWLTTLSPLIQPEQINLNLTDEAGAVRPLLCRWAQHNMLAPRDIIYAQRLWLLGLAGWGLGIPLPALTEAIQLYYDQIAAQLPSAERPDGAAILQKAARTDAALLKYCYNSRSTPPPES
jgi:hypothetical protein